MDCSYVLLSIPKNQVCCPFSNTKPIREFFDCDAVSGKLVQASKAFLVKFWHKAAKIFTRALRVIVAKSEPFSNYRIVDRLHLWN